MDKLINTIKGYAGQNASQFAQPRLASVSSVDPNTYTARVAIQPEQVLSGWLPIMTIWAGDGWGLTALPSIGDQVLLLAQEGDPEQAIIIGRLWSGKTVCPPASVGEFCIRHSSGSFIRFHNDGTIESAASLWTHTGNLTVQGALSDSHGALAVLRLHFNEHTHPPSSSPAEPQD